MNPITLAHTDVDAYLRYLGSLLPVSERVDMQNKLGGDLWSALVESTAARLAVARWERQCLDIRCGWNEHLFTPVLNRRARAYYALYVARLQSVDWSTTTLADVEQKLLADDDNPFASADALASAPPTTAVAREFDVGARNTYRCPRCGCTRRLADSRHSGGADEGSTYLLTCADCGHTQRMR